MSNLNGALIEEFPLSKLTNNGDDSPLKLVKGCTRADVALCSCLCG